MIGEPPNADDPVHADPPASPGPRASKASSPARPVSVSLLPRPGQVLRVDRRASVQFAGTRALTVRVIRLADRVTYLGWCWVEVYVLDPTGEAVAKRWLFVQPAGLQLVTLPPVRWAARVPAGVRC